MADTLVERLEARRVGLAILDAHGQFEIENKSYGSPVVWGEAHTTLLGSAAILAMKDRLDEAAARIRELEAREAALNKAFDTLEVAFIEFSLAQQRGPGWYTRGDVGLYAQVRVWLDRGFAAIKAARTAPPEPNTPAQDGGPDHG